MKKQEPLNQSTTDLATDEIIELCREVRDLLKKKTYLDLNKSELNKVNKVISVAIASRVIMDYLNTYPEDD